MRRPFGYTLILGSGILFCLVSISELLLRLDFIQAKLPYPSIGSSNHSLDVKIHLLDKMVQREGQLDCIFLGSSQVNTNINPDAFQEAFLTATGNSIRSFNFGVSAMTPYPAFGLLRILLKRYHPRMIIWGITPIDLYTRKKHKETELTANPWVRYQLGKNDFSGWLTDKSYLYRYYLRFRVWMDFPEIARIYARQEVKTNSKGYRKNLSNSLDEKLLDPELQARYRKVMGKFKEDPGVLVIFEKSFALDPETAIVLVEMPIHPVTLPLYPGGQKTHYKIIDKVKNMADRHGIHFIPATHYKLVTDDKWLNYNHLSCAGADHFSRWLGIRIGEAVKRGVIPGPRPGMSRR